MKTSKTKKRSFLKNIGKFSFLAFMCGTMFVIGTIMIFALDLDENKVSGSTLSTAEWNTVARTLNIIQESDGNIGIGTTNPRRQLEIYRNTSWSSMAIVSKTDQLAALFLGDTEHDNKGGVKYSNATDKLIFQSNAAENMVIDSAGNVGIGTTGAETKLHVDGGDSETIALLEGDHTDGAFLNIKNNPPSGDMQTRAGIRFKDTNNEELGGIYVWGSSGASPLVLAANDNMISIGTEGILINSESGSEATKLDVNGSICIKGNCKESWDAVGGGDAQSTKCSAGQYLDGSGSCKTAANIVSDGGGSGRETLLTIHSQTTSVPSAPSGWTKLWQGYSLVNPTSGSGNSGAQDLASTGSCVESFKPMPFIECSTANNCDHSTGADYSYWLSSDNSFSDDGSTSLISTARTKISRCAVFSAPKSLLVKHSYTTNTPSAPSGWTQLWTGYSLLATSGGVGSAPQDLGRTGSCMKTFRALAYIECTSGSCDYQTGGDYTYWMSTVNDFGDGSGNLSGKSTILPFISRCSVYSK